MSTFVKGGGVRTPFGKNVFLRSAKTILTESYTVSKNSVPSALIDSATEKILQPGTVMAKITSGPQAGKIGPYQAAGTLELQTLTKSGTISGGTYTITFNGYTTGLLQWNSSAAVVQAALEALPSVGTGGVVVTGGSIDTAPLAIQFWLQGNEPAITVDTSLLTGSTPGITVAETIAGAAGAADGRQTSSNIVGLLETFLPWQLLERDVEVAVIYSCSAVQGWCIELNAAGASIPVSNTTATAMQRGGAAGKLVDITWK